LATIITSATPWAPANAEAEPPPGAGALLFKASK
jgi:hypothetical protein